MEKEKMFAYMRTFNFEIRRGHINLALFLYSYPLYFLFFSISPLSSIFSYGALICKCMQVATHALGHAISPTDGDEESDFYYQKELSRRSAP